MLVRIPKAKFHGIFLNFAECEMGLKGRKFFFRGKCGISIFLWNTTKNFFFYTVPKRNQVIWEFYVNLRNITN
jgi:hypothetical protein